MASEKQRTAARRNIKKAATAAKRKRTISHLPKSTRTALGKQAAKVAKQKHRARNDYVPPSAPRWLCETWDCRATLRRRCRYSLSFCRSQHNQSYSDNKEHNHAH